MTYSRLDLANEALDKLGLIGSGQGPDPDDTEKVLYRIDAFQAELRARELYTIADIEHIEPEAFMALAEYLAWFVQDKFAQPKDETRRQRAEFLLLRIASTGPTGEAQDASWF